MKIEELIQLIQSSPQHQHFYHFTDEANLASIGVSGLISKARMRAQGIWPEAPGGNTLSWQLDERKGIFNDVSLCFTANHPMRFVCQRDGRMPNPRHLRISPQVLQREGIRVAFGIANAEAVNIVPLAEAIERIDVEVIYGWTNWSDPAIQARLQAAERFELLVPDGVPRELIVGI